MKKYIFLASVLLFVRSIGAYITVEDERLYIALLLKQSEFCLKAKESADKEFATMCEQVSKDLIKYSMDLSKMVKEAKEDRKERSLFMSALYMHKYFEPYSSI